MAERYSRLFSLSEQLYVEGAPVFITAGALLKDSVANCVLVQLKFCSLSTKRIKAVVAQIVPKDVAGDVLGNPVEYQYLDLSVLKDDEFGSKCPIVLPDNTTRSFAVRVTRVFFGDGSEWNGEETLWSSLSALQLLEDRLQDKELAKEYRLALGEDCKYYPQQIRDLWGCTCGTLNHQSEKRCSHCHRTYDTLAAVSWNDLAEKARVRLRLEAEAAETASREAKKRTKRNKRIVGIAILFILAAIAFCVFLNAVIIPGGKYSDAVTLMEAEEYDAALALFEELGEYRDSNDLMEQCNSAIRNEPKYREAMSLIDEDNERARSLFLELGDYKDSEEQANRFKYVITKKTMEITYSGYHQGNEFYDVAEFRYEFSDSGMLKSILVAYSPDMFNEYDEKFYFDDQLRIVKMEGIPNGNPAPEYVSIKRRAYSDFDYSFGEDNVLQWFMCKEQEEGYNETVPYVSETIKKFNYSNGILVDKEVNEICVVNGEESTEDNYVVQARDYNIICNERGIESASIYGNGYAMKDSFEYELLYNKGENSADIPAWEFIYLVM